MRYHLLRLIAILAVLLVALWPLSALAAPSVNISGLEVFPGIPNGDKVYGTSFVGWVAGSGAVPGSWAPCTTGHCGAWTVAINYRDPNGTGIGKGPATVLTGVWFLRTPNPNGYSYSGRVTGGTVTWPSTLAGAGADIGCGDGVATVTASLSGGANSFGSCLDDTHGLIPPPIWGTISFP